MVNNKEEKDNDGKQNGEIKEKKDNEKIDENLEKNNNKDNKEEINNNEKENENIIIVEEEINNNDKKNENIINDEEEKKNNEKNKEDENSMKNKEEDKNNNIINENSDNKKKEIFSIKAILNESENKGNDIEKNKINDGRTKMDKRYSEAINIDSLKFNSVNKDEEKNNNDETIIFNRKQFKTINNSSTDTVMRSYTDVSMKYTKKKDFINELSLDPKYQKLIELKEKTEEEINKTVGTKGSSSFIKSLVSRNKARFCYDGFDLDLTYITTKIIAMGLPSTSFEGFYRNNMEDVKRFFNTRHPSHYKVYNLCQEKQYPQNSFYKQGYYPFPDHEAPPLSSLMPFCKDAKQFLDENDENVVAIHCKAGKGRTGTFICCLLLYLGTFDTADECMKYYGLMRVGAEKGVTIPSQKRYVNYFEQMLKNNISIDPLKYKTISIQELKMYTIPSFSKFGSSCTPTFTIENDKKVYKYSDINKKKTTYNNSVKSAAFPLDNAKIHVAGDVLITFYHLTFFGKDKMFKFWFNTQFLDDNGILEIEKSCLDKAFKDKENKFFSPEFKIEMKYNFL